MRLRLFSDLHLEFKIASPIPEGGPDFDVAIVCGDIDKPPRKAMRYLASLPNLHGKPVLFVPGNHEFYGYAIDEHEMLDTAFEAETGVFNLHRRSMIIDGVRFVGATLWTDYALYGDVKRAMLHLANGLNDHIHIGTVRVDPDAEPDDLRVLRKRLDFFQPADALARHIEDLRHIESVLAEPFDGPTVVMTHHAPHPKSIEPKYRNSNLNPGFASDLTRTIEAYRPALWCHGHVHSSHDYRVGDTRIVANPRGYERRGSLENAAFDPHLTVDVEPATHP